MGKKGGGGGLGSIFSRSSSSSRPGVHSPPAAWPSCYGDAPQTDSFHDDPCSSIRCAAAPVAARHRRLLPAGEMYKTANSVYFVPGDGEPFFFDEEEEEELVEVVEDDGFLTAAASEEAVIRRLGRTASSGDRFFFDLQGPATSSILPSPPEPEKKQRAEEEQEQRAGEESGRKSKGVSLMVEESVAVAVESADPYGDFRASMEEMVAAHGVRGWADLEELLTWYLRVNAKRNHPLIVAAFVDLLVRLAGAAAAPESSTATSSGAITTTTSSSSSSSSTTTTTTTAAAMAGCGGGDAASSSSSSSPSCGPPSEHGHDEAGRGEEEEEED